MILNLVTKLKNSAICALLSCVAFNVSAMDKRVDLPQGHVVGVNNAQETVNQWLGVQYAQQPVGKRRWQAPHPLPQSDNTYQANKLGHQCTQNGKKGVVGQESCLSLNIYRPNNDETLPVLVYFHGGNNQTGNASQLNPDTFVNDLNAVVVTVNYRLGPLGFNPLNVLKMQDKAQASGNFSLLDQAQSLDWIKDNIAQFGGNPENVTVSGFSAGGRDVMAMLISPIFKHKFQHAIVFSGGMTTADVGNSQAIFAKRIAHLAVQKGVKPDESSARKWLKGKSSSAKQFLYSLSDADLVKCFPEAGIRMSRFPHLYRDGYVLPKDGFATQAYNSVPIMMFTGKNEFSFFALSDPYFAKKSILTNTEHYLDYQFVFKYGGMLYKRFNVERSASQMIDAYDAPIYTSEVNYGANAQIAGKSFKKFGSFHGVYLPLLDSSMAPSPFAPGYKQEGARKLASIMKRQLTSFVHNGQPSVSITPQWGAWNQTSKARGQSIYVMDANKKAAITYLSSTDYSDEDVFNMMKSDVSLSEKKKSFLIRHVLNGRWFSQTIDRLESAQ